MTPSPRPPLAQEGDPSKLPLTGTPHSKEPHNLSPHPGHSPQQVQEEKVREMKLPLIRPPVQELAPQAAPDPPEEGEVQVVKLPQIPAPFSEQLPQNTGALPHDLRPAKERQAPKAGYSFIKKIPDVQALPPNQEPVQQTGARKKKITPIHRDS